MESVVRWSFDASVASSFVSYARRHIPAYDRVVDLSVSVAKEFCQPTQKIAEVGCATGRTIRCLEEAGYLNVLGIDSSQAMLDACVVRHASLVCSDSFPVERGPFQLVLANWTLHFVEPGERAGYLDNVRRGLAAGGKLILSDKTAQSPFVEQLYHGFKRSQGVSQDEVTEKKRRLAGILEPLSVDWYVGNLRRLGFTTEILWAEHGFVTFFASL
jgi:tRNA (cmo5U34)-methyltransferase